VFLGEGTEGGKEKEPGSSRSPNREASRQVALPQMKVGQTWTQKKARRGETGEKGRTFDWAASSVYSLPPLWCSYRSAGVLEKRTL